MNCIKREKTLINDKSLIWNNNFDIEKENTPSSNIIVGKISQYTKNVSK